MNPADEYVQSMTRRHFFGRTALGLGTAALASLLPAGAAAGTKTSGLPGLPHFAPRARRVIYLFMNGGPAQMDMWDYKPKMDALFDKDLPDSVRKGQRLTTMTSGQARFPIAPSKYKFARHGKSGTLVSELLPWTAKVVDELAVIKTVWTRRPSTTTRPSPTSAPAISCPAAPASAPGSAMAWAPRTAICRPSW